MNEKYIIEILTAFKLDNTYREQSKYNFVLNDKINGYKEHDTYKLSIRYLEIENVIINIENSTYELTDFGNSVIKNIDNWQNIIANENLRINKLKLKEEIDLELAQKMLKEYPWTKWFARIGAFIGIGLAILELLKLLKK